MQRVAALFAVVLALISGLVPAAHGAEPIRGYIYDEIGGGRAGALHDLAIVIDVAKNWVEIQRKADARIGSMDGDFGSKYEDCGNEAFYCLTGPLEIVIPKAMPMKQWKYHGLSCQSVAQPGSDAYRITCRSPKYRGRPTFTYSLSRGVLSIDSSPVAGGYRYELRGEHGLFSLGSNP
ncbi:hypothetical protein [Dyella subtropica]|uniref:hypothetical protein n=1 Tax=Dyella subtropica TaxID=2992127 RepID=UPI002250DDA2|nr:hypothetical protein [Dyella subtropica]